MPKSSLQISKASVRLNGGTSKPYIDVYVVNKKAKHHTVADIVTVRDIVDYIIRCNF